MPVPEVSCTFVMMKFQEFAGAMIASGGLFWSPGTGQATVPHVGRLCVVPRTEGPGGARIPSGPGVSQGREQVSMPVALLR